LAETFIRDKVGTQKYRQLSWRDSPERIAATRPPLPHPRDTLEERVEYCKLTGTPPLEEDWVQIKLGGDYKACLLAIVKNVDE
jgi:hypothetical protein